jgi:ADP-heptose:LPS heptosyltransferase
MHGHRIIQRHGLQPPGAPGRHTIIDGGGFICFGGARQSSRGNPINSHPDHNDPERLPAASDLHDSNAAKAPTSPAEPTMPAAPAAVTGWRRVRVRIRFLSKNLRHRSREYLGWLLARVIGARHYATALCAEEVSSVLICRINGRIGNTLFLTPLIRYLHELLPNAAIDLALAYPQAQELLRGMPGVRRIIVFPHREPLKIGRYVAALRSLRAWRYDLAIDPTEFSTSGRVMLMLCRSRYRLGFVTSAQWAPLTHAVPLPRAAMHQAVRPLYLPHRIFGAPLQPQAVRLWLPLPQDELAEGRRIIAQAIAPEPLRSPSNVFGFFAHAANLKLIDRSWWLAFWDAFLGLEPQATPVEFLPSAQLAPTDARFASLHVRSTRGLTAAIAATRVFISTDTGPMHLASTTAVPTVGLFLASDPGLYGPLKPDDLAIAIPRCSPGEVAQRCQRIWVARGAAASGSAASGSATGA